MTVLVKNKHAYRNYEILESFTGGLELSGGEVKSLRGNQGNLQGAFVTLQKNKHGAGELFIKHLSIAPYQVKNSPNGYNPERTRKVLLKRREINRIERELNNKGTTLIPIEVFTQNNLIKLSFALARGKKKYDKRQDLKESAQKRDAERENKIRFT